MTDQTLTDRSRPEEWSELTWRVLRSAAWYPERSVPVDRWEPELRAAGFVLHDAARSFLAEFGGLRIDQAGPGRTAARSPFALDPEAALHDFEVFDDLGDQAGAPLYPVGAVGRGVSYLGMTAGGAVYLGMDDAGLLAESGDEALDKLVEGRA
jgi:hypothetical protein